MKIVVGYDGSEAAKRALERAAELNKDGEPVTVVSAFDVHMSAGRGPVFVDEPEREERRRQLQEAEKLLAGKGVEIRAVEGHGDPGRAIEAEAKELGADLIVVGTHARGALGRTVLGSVSTHVVHHAPCDVLVVR
jgi:nucleotide-binding universal stress UspA family protein